MKPMPRESSGGTRLSALLAFGGLSVVLYALRPFPVLATVAALLMGGLTYALGYRVVLAILSGRLKP